MNFLYILFFAFLASCGKAPQEKIEKPKAFVSVAPYKYFADKISGGHIDVQTIVPTGVSSHSYEPTPRETALLEKGEIWFQIGDSFEKKISPVLLEHKKDLELVDMRQGISLIESECQGKCHHDHDRADNHIWLSPKLAKVQSKKIADVFAKKYPKYADEFYQNLSLLEKELDLLNAEIHETLASTANRVMLVSHPAFAYFCKDFDFKQLSVEVDGKDPLPQQMEELIQKTSQEVVSIVLLIPQYNNKGAKLLSQHLNVPSATVDPYSENYSENLRHIAQVLAQ